MGDYNFEVSHIRQPRDINRSDHNLLGRRSEFRLHTKNNKGKPPVRRWQCVSMSYGFIILVSGLALVVYSIYQMYVIEVFDKIIDSFDITASVELARKLPPLSTIIDQTILSLGVVTSWLTLSWCVFGAYKKHRACISATIASLFLISSISMSLSISLLVTRDEFLDVVKIPDIEQYGLVNSTTAVIDGRQKLVNIKNYTIIFGLSFLLNCIFHSAYSTAYAPGLLLISCCGISGASDYETAPCFLSSRPSNCSLSISPHAAVPKSCCKDDTLIGCNNRTTAGHPANKNTIYTRGCGKLIEDSVKDRFRIVSALLLALASVLMCGLPWLCCLYRAISDDRRYSEISLNISKLQHRCHHQGTCNRRSCHHSFPVLSQQLKASYCTLWEGDPTGSHRSRPFDNISAKPRRSMFSFDTDTPKYSPLSYQSYNPDRASLTLNPRPSQNLMSSNANAQMSGSNIKFPVSTVVDPDTELTDGGELPFEKLVVVPIQGLNCKHRVRSAALTRAPDINYSGDVNMMVDNQPIGFPANGQYLYRSMKSSPVNAVGSGVFHMGPSSGGYGPGDHYSTIKAYTDEGDWYGDSGSDSGSEEETIRPRRKIRRRRGVRRRSSMRRRPSVRRSRSGSRIRRRRRRRRF